MIVKIPISPLWVPTQSALISLFNILGAGASGVTVTGSTGSINEARRLQTNMHIERVSHETKN